MSVRLLVTEGPYSAVEAGLRDGSIDFFVGPPPGYALPPELLVEPLFDNRRAVLCRKGHPLSKKRSLRDLAEVLISIPVREQFPMPSVVAVRRSGLPLTPAAEFMLDLLRRGVNRLRPPRA